MIIIGSILLIRIPLHTLAHILPTSPSFGAALVWMLVLAAAAIFPIPAEPFMTLCMHVFGVTPGTVINVVGVLLGGCMLFAVGRIYKPLARTVTRLLSRLNRKVVSRNLSSVGKFWSVVVLQLLPLPFLFVNLFLGASENVKWATYVFASFLGFAPYQLAWTGLYVGVLHVHRLSLVGVIGAAFVVLVFALHAVWKRVSRLSK